MNFNDSLFECSCCEKIQLSSEQSPRPFLQAAELRLLEYIGKSSLFDIDRLVLLPNPIGKIGSQRPRGFKAEYKVYCELEQLKHNIYVFYSLQDSNKNEEFGDFLLITKSSIIILEVKAFELSDNPLDQEYKMMEKTILQEGKRVTQKERVTGNIKNFLTNHGCCDSLSVHFFYLYVNSTRPKSTHCNYEWFISNDLFKDALFQDNYLEKMNELCTKGLDQVIVDENDRYAIRTLLAWCYGSYFSPSSTQIGYPASHWNIWRELEKCLNEEYKRSKTDIGGIFLTPLQKLIVECNHPFLQITGMPGTGKTYCLIFKMVRVFFELWDLHLKQNKKEKQLIIAYHRNDKTIRFIKELFWRHVKKQIKQKQKDNKVEIPKFILFVGGKNNQDIDTEEPFEVRKYDIRTKFKVFYDDVNWDFFGLSYCEGRATEIIWAMERSNFCWFTSYRDLSLNTTIKLNVPKELRDVYHTQHLSDSLRYTGNIHALLKQLDARRLGFSSRFSPGTRVIGEKPQFASVKDCRAMEFKVHELLKKFDKEGIKRDEIAVIKTESWMDMVRDALRMDMNQAGESDTQSVPRTDFQEEVVRLMSTLGIDDFHLETENTHTARTNDFQNEATNLMRALGISDDNLEIEDAHFISFFCEIDSKMNRFSSQKTPKFSLRGMEFHHVILCVTPMPKSFTEEDKLVTIREELKNKGFNETQHFIRMLEDESKKWETYRSLDLLEAISRAIASVIIVYTDGDVLLSKIAEQIKYASPEICPNNTYNKTYEMGEIVKERDAANGVVQ